jgi:hypothetical protein
MTGNVQKRLVVYLDASFVRHWVGQDLDNPREAAWYEASVACWRRMEGKVLPVVSYHVWTEIGRGKNAGEAEARKKAIAGLPSWAYTDEAIALAGQLLDAGAVRAKKKDDALHIALAAVGGADALLSWNFKDIVNEGKLPLIQSMVEQAGYRCPLLVSPDNLPEDWP